MPGHDEKFRQAGHAVSHGGLALEFRLVTIPADGRKFFEGFAGTPVFACRVSVLAESERNECFALRLHGIRRDHLVGALSGLAPFLTEIGARKFAI